MLRIAIDLDGTICTTKQPHEEYGDVVPLPGAVEALKQLKKEGHYIIIHTARHMRSQKANHGKILANFGYFYNWLKKWDIPHDEIVIGKPDVDLFLDDKGYRHTNWKDTLDFVNHFNKEMENNNK